MAGVLPDIFNAFGNAGHGVLPFGDAPSAPNPVDANRHAILGYLAGALQGGNLGQSIGRGLQGFLGGAQADANEQARRAAVQYAAQQPDIDPAIRSVLAQSPALAMQYLQARARPHVTREIAEYEYARRQGFRGTFTDFMQRMRGAAPPMPPRAPAQPAPPPLPPAEE
jgi:hypothetical protein